MLTPQLTLNNGQITVHANERRSHSFSIRDLDNTNLKNFVSDPKPYGEKLFDTLFKDGSEARKGYDELSKQTERTIVLVLESNELDVIAWEYAYHDNAYIVEDFAFMRVLPEKERPPSNGRLNKGVERVPLLFIPANPLVDLSGEPMRELDIASEWHKMTQHIVKSNAPFDLIELRPATPAALQSIMARFQNGLIAHFSGHGAATKDGAFLLFENENGSSNPLEAREFVREVKDQAWIGFLSACQSAVAERTEFGNLARELVKAGVPFALGMQFNLPDPFAPNISGQFYNYLSQGHAVPEAARQARRAVKRENEFYVGMIALYAAHPDEAGKMGWSSSGARTVPTFAEADVSDLPTPSGFIGRQRELMNIGTQLLTKKKPNTVTLHGAGGIGKTALMRQALLRFAPSFEATLAIALDPLPSLESVLGRLERFLNLPSPCSKDTKERERIVRERLTSKRMLLGLDNFETLNYALNEKERDAEKTAKSLHSFFKHLASNGVTLCVTSREVTNLGGEFIIDIEGLPNDAGGRLFQDNIARQKDEIYIEKTQQVSELVGGHPLALRLLASAYDDQVGTSLDQYIESLRTFLSKANDKWTEQERHESLGRCFAFSMDNLPKDEEGKELKTGISRLSIFISFFTSYMVAPTLAGNWPANDKEDNSQQDAAQKIVRSLWERGLLERQSLPLQTEIIYMYRLHPALGQFATEHAFPEDLAAMRETHFRSMSQLASRAYPASGGRGIYSSPLTSSVAHVAMPDMLKAAQFKQDKESSRLLYHLAFLNTHFGDLDGAIKLYQQSLHIDEGLGDLQGKSATLHAIAGIYVTRGDLDGAMKLYREVLDIVESLGDVKGKSTILHSMATIYVTRGDLDGAMKLYREALDIVESLGDVKGKSPTMHGMAGIYVTRGDLDGAMELYQEALGIEESMGDLRGKSATLHEMAAIYMTRGDLDAAMKLYQESLQIFESLGDVEGKSSTMHEMAYILRERGDLDGAMKLYQQALQILEGLGDLKGKSATLHAIAGIFVTRGDLDRAMKLYQESLEINEGLGDLKGTSTTLHAMAAIYVTRGDLDGAMKLYQEALQIFEGLNDLRGKSAALYAMAYIPRMRGDLDGAIKLYQQSLQIFEGLGDLKGKSVTLLQIGNIMPVLGDTNGAMKMYQESLEINESMGDLQGKSTTLHAMAYILRERGDLDGAMKLYQQALQIFEGLDDLKGQAATLHEMAEIPRRRGILDEAMKLYQQALQILEGLGDLQGKSATLTSMATIASLRGDLDGAMKLYEQALEIKETLGDLQGKSVTLAMLGQLLVERKDYPRGILALYESLETLTYIGARPYADKVAEILVSVRQIIGDKDFNDAWKQITVFPIPNWLR